MASKLKAWLKQPAPVAGYFGGVAGIVGAICIDYTAGLPWSRRIAITATAIVVVWVASVLVFAKSLPFDDSENSQN